MGGTFRIPMKPIQVVFQPCFSTPSSVQQKAGPELRWVIQFVTKLHPQPLKRWRELTIPKRARYQNCQAYGWLFFWRCWWMHWAEISHDFPEIHGCQQIHSLSYITHSLGVGFKTFFIVHCLGFHDPIWLAHLFSNLLVQPPTSN